MSSKKVLSQKHIENITVINPVVIIPIDPEISVRANSVKLLNDFKTLGFYKRNAFVNIVQEKEPDYKNYDSEKNLLSFWAGRFSDKGLNDDLGKIIESLKSE